ncbi:MAG: fibronectin type III domain-containing protein [Ignavibacterium album]|uniref:fibronectin type III domain-containing protein n=1 Tax=Ignavibacterium album TaxID=591197 RepID=UPI0026EDEAE2|nr:fibronectin type III domain-containing protein [Ignavibacterium album]MBI5660962.1 fibronectin type III domain-containing protein [Ignavibacterium album]
MRKILLTILILLQSVFLISCYEELIDSPIGNKPPKTFISVFADSTITKQPSSVKLSWWGDDPDGLIIGYFISIDGINWTFTTKNDSVISFTLIGSDTTYLFRVAAVDNSGNGLYDNQLISGNINFGHEPFTDLNNNGRWDSGEPFTDCGAIDPEPATLLLPLKNSAPVIKFLVDKNDNTILIPDTTFPVASFGWTITDLDGDNTISKVFIALNDTSQKIQLPASTRFVTIKVEPPYNSDIVECDVYLGTSITTPYHTKLPGLKLNDTNRFYVYCEDIAGSVSQLLAMPSENSSLTWYVKKPKGDFLIIDDYATSDNSASFYNQVLDSLNLLSRTDVWDIKLGKTSTTPGKLLPKFISPQFTETLKLFKVVYWYTDNDPTLEPAQISVREYIISGGKVFFSMIFPQQFDPRGLSDFLPVDSLSPAPISFIPRSTLINPADDGITLNYPLLSIDDSTVPVARIRTYYPNPFSAKTLYKLGLSGEPIIGFKSSDSKLVYMGIPLHRANGNPFNVKNLFDKVLFEEFGLSR